MSYSSKQFEFMHLNIKFSNTWQWQMEIFLLSFPSTILPEIPGWDLAVTQQKCKPSKLNSSPNLQHGP